MSKRSKKKRQARVAATKAQLPSATKAQLPSSAQNSAPTWVFPEQRRTEGHSFGNSALYTVPQSIPSLVRETAQNSLDAGVGGKVVMRFTLFDLPQGCLRRERFLKSIRFEDRLRSHIEAAVDGGGERQTAVRLAAALEELDAADSILRVVRVEDYGARGLSGDDFGAEGAFCALVRDEENSQKQDQTAGGSFGLGSKTLWSCSKILTVFFSSIVAEREAQGIRVIGKTDLGFHEIHSGAPFGYQGAGFFGRTKEGSAESIWPADASFVKDALLERKPPEGAMKVGTTALIVGFEDPSSDREDSDQILNRLATAVAENLWPAILSKQLNVFVEHYVGDEAAPQLKKQIDPVEFVPSLVDAYLKQSKNDVKAKLERPGDVVSVPVNLTVPATRLEGKVDPQHDEVTAECRLVIRLSEADAKDSQLVDNIGFARGRAMITRYAAKRALSAGARPFHAVLLAGKLAGKGQLQEYAEKFLRYAEPPSHDDWEFSRGLGARYARGAGAKLGQFHEAVTAALAEYVAAPSSPSEEGPEILQRLFRLPKTAVGHKSTWRIVEPEVKIVGESIHVSATIALNRTRGTRILPKVAIAKESGIAHRCEWQSLESSDAAIDGTALVVDEGQKTVSFEGWARPKMVGLQLDRCAITIAVGVDDQESTNDA